MARLPDLVRDSQLEVKARNGCTVHTYFESSPASGQRAIPREETWKQERHIGDGGFGSVWLERCVSGRRKGDVRAVKRLALGQKSAKDAAYIRELEALAKFSHSKYDRCFVRSFGWYESLGSLCVTMEYCELGDLQCYLPSAPALPEIEAQEITFQILEGVRYMHENDFAHRDLKPGNILINSKPPGPWWIKIADFGISKRIEESLGSPSTVKGTLEFMAPELLGLTAVHPTSNNSVSTNPYAADMWSLGEIAFQLLTKQRAFPQLAQLIQYVQGLKPFPNALLAGHDVSSFGQDFISSTMLQSPDSRLKAAQAWDHEWMEKCRLLYSSPLLATSARTSGGMEELPTVSVTEPPAEQFATWSLTEERNSRTQASISPFMRSSARQTHRRLTAEPPYSFEAHSDLETPPEEYSFLQALEGHSDAVSAVAFSPDGKLLASCSGDRTVRLWDAGSGRLRQTLEGHGYSVRAVAFSPDGKLLASCSDDRTVRLWDAGSGRLRQTLEGHGYSVSAVAFSPDGKLLASCSGDRTVRLWDAGSGRLRQTLEGHGGAVWDVAFSPDGKLLASCSSDETVRLWDAGSGRLRQTLEGHGGAVWAVAFSPDGKLLASCSSDETVRLWDAGSGRLRQTLEGHGGAVWAVAFSPDGKLLASCSYDGTVRLWDAGSGRLRQTLEGHGSSVCDVAFSPDGKLLASCSGDRTVRLWETLGGYNS